MKKFLLGLTALVMVLTLALSVAVAEASVPRVAALKGPTAMGMVKMMSDAPDAYDFTISAAIDEITPKLVKGEVDIAAVPANMASVLYNNTEGAVKVLAINTLGVLYIVENGDSGVSSIADLKGRTLYASGKGASPEYALNYLLAQNGLDPRNRCNRGIQVRACRVPGLAAGQRRLPGAAAPALCDHCPDEAAHRTGRAGP